MMSMMATLRSGYLVQVIWTRVEISAGRRRPPHSSNLSGRAANHDLHGIGRHRVFQLRNQSRWSRLVLRYQPMGPSGTAPSCIITWPRAGTSKITTV